MVTDRPTVIVTFASEEASRRILVESLGDVADVSFWPEVAQDARDEVLRNAKALIGYNPFADLGSEAIARLESCEFMQCLTAGVDYLRLSSLPDRVRVAYNAGAYAEPMAEHVLAMALSAAKHLPREHRLMGAGEFNQFHLTKRIAGMTCGILGYGETGREVARLMRALGVRVQAINRSGRTDDPVDFVGTSDDLDRVLSASDILVVTISLTRRTEGLIGARELRLMKPEAILVNVARGEIVDQEALYRHLVSTPGFTACLEAWWVEPIRHGRFEIKHPFLELPNVIASPHNSAMTGDTTANALRRGAINLRRVIMGQEPRFVAGEDEKFR